jgi:AIPR protein
VEVVVVAETPIEILHLPEQLSALFSGKVPEATSGNSPEQREANFLSRSLAAYAIYKLSGCSLDEAAASVVDGGGDGGIDAIFYAATNATLFVVQSKYIATGRGEPDLGDVTKFKTGLENLLQGKFECFSQNAAWQNRASQLAVELENAVQIRSVLVYSGIHSVSDDRLSLFDDLKQRFCSGGDNYVEFQSYNLTTVHNWLIGKDESLGVQKVQLTILQPGWVRTPYETVFGLLSLKDLAKLYIDFGNQLIVANIRAYKGRTEVNEQILTTIKNEPHHFFYLNNGLTAYCEKLKVDNADRANSESKKITAYNLSIVNGAQTLGSVAEFFNQHLNFPSDAMVFIKVISLERCVDDRTFAEYITRSTNFQNQIGLRDFVTQDEQQGRIANQLKLTEITYHYKDDADTPEPDESNFTLQEATTASACLAKLQDCDDFCARILANRSSLWSMEETYPSDQFLRSRYSRVFRADRSARMVWRAVQVQRLVIKAMKDSGKTASGVRKAFFENARWLILNVVFIKLRSEQGNELYLTSDEKSAVPQSTISFAEALWNVCEAQGYLSRKTIASGGIQFDTTRHFRSIFSNASDCQILRKALLANLAQSQTISPSASSDSYPHQPTSTN